MSDVRDFGAMGDGKTDDTEAIRHAVAAGDGVLHFSAGIYLISGTIEIPLAETGPGSLTGDEGVSRVRMTAAGPAFRLVGSHAGTGDPGTVKPHVRERERLPTLRNIVVEGAHDEADGVEVVETMQALFEGVLVRHVRHGIRLTRRNRNVIINHCHIYHNTGAGVYLDSVNLHQINISGSHISYNRLGGIRIERSEVRNLQITGNDIEYNNAKAHGELPAEPTAEIYIDTTAEGSSVNEITIASNTIQATETKGGANIRILNKPGTGRPPGLVSIVGNVIGSQENNVHLTGCYGVTLSGNSIYSCGQSNLQVENSRQISIVACNFRRHTPAFGAGIRIVDSEDCVLSGCGLRDESEEGQKSRASLLELRRCRRINITGCQFIDGVPYGIDADDCDDVRIANCTVAETRPAPKASGCLRFSGTGKGNYVALSTLDGETEIGPAAGVKFHETNEAR